MDRGAWQATVHGVAKSQLFHSLGRRSILMLEAVVSVGSAPEGSWAFQENKYVLGTSSA